jgi:hypothetical protein
MEYKLVNLIKREVIDGQMRVVREQKWFHIAEEFTYQRSLVGISVTDQIVIDDMKNVYLFRDSNVYSDVLLDIDDIQKRYDETQKEPEKWRNKEYRLDLERYYEMVIRKMRKFEREKIIDNILGEDQKYYDHLIQCC